MFEKEQITENQFIFKGEKRGVQLYLKREDLLDNEVSGNKFRKLKYNVLEAEKHQKSTLLTFGGAFSNHISAVAAVGKRMGFKTIGIIRGEELAVDLEKTLAGNPTLKFAVSCGMQLHFVTRKFYREKHTPEVSRTLQNQFGDFYLIPEGGTNHLAVKGCEEIIGAEEKKFDYLCCPVGTGGTVSGIIRASALHQKVLGFSALKGDFLHAEIRRWTEKKNWEIITNFHFGGYAKVTAELIRFINQFKHDYGVLLDPVYTGKMLFGILKLIDTDYFPKNTCILAVHTGGLQGIDGMNQYLEKKGIIKIKK